MRKLALGALLVGLLVACGSSSKQPPIIDSGSGSSGSDGGPPGCNILTQTGCDAGQKCSWIHDQLMPAVSHVGCAPDGTVAVGGSCTYGMPPSGWDNCTKGGVCEGGVCKLICDQAGGAPMCDAMHSCQVYEGFLGPPQMEAAGVCDPTCDPLADNDFGSGTGHLHTGSACATGEGCYGFWNGSALSHFSCASTPPHGVTPPPPGSTTLFHRALCTSMAGCENANNQAYLNGCGGGYMPLITTDTAGTMTVSCMSFCKPADCTSDATPGCGATAGVNRIGAAPHRCNQIDSDGAYNGTANGDQCVYGWNFEIDGTTMKVRKSQYSDTTGICLDHSKYHLLDNAGNASQTAWPACATLPLTAVGSQCGGVAGTSQPIDGCTAQDFGCVSTTTGMVTTEFQNAHRAAAHIERPRMPYHDLQMGSWQ